MKINSVGFSAQRSDIDYERVQRAAERRRESVEWVEAGISSAGVSILVEPVASFLIRLTCRAENAGGSRGCFPFKDSSPLCLGAV